MIRAITLVIFQDRGHPDLGHPQSLDVVEVFNDPLQVSTMATIGMLPVHTFVKPVDLIIVGVGVGESIGHNQINRVSGAEAFSIARFGSSLG